MNFITKPPKQIPETEATFEQVNRINQQADENPTSLRISIDAKVGLKIGEFDKGM
ncbi:ISAzo13-like element transposase-related protein [Myxosarcina sp. GI1(2024)]